MTGEVSIKRPFNGHTEKVFKFIVWLVTITASVATAWSVLRGSVELNASRIDTACGRVEKIENRVQILERISAEQNIHNAWTKETLTEIKQAVKESR